MVCTFTFKMFCGGSHINIQTVLVVLSLLFHLISGGTTGTIPTTGQGNMAGFDPRFLQSMFLYGGNVDMNKAFNQEYDQTYYFNDGAVSTGFGEVSSVRIHGNMNSGFTFDFNIKASQHQQVVNVTSPIDGVTIVTNQYSSGDSGYSYSIGPISLQTAIGLFSYAMSSMTPSNAG